MISPWLTCFYNAYVGSKLDDDELSSTPGLWEERELSEESEEKELNELTLDVLAEEAELSDWELIEDRSD